MKSRFKANYLLIPLITIAVAALGSAFTSFGMPWYDTLIKPELTPPKYVFPIAWNVIFLCATISAMIVWNKGSGEIRFLWFRFRHKSAVRFNYIIGLFITNAILNVAWSFLFFYRGLIYPALVEMLVLQATIIALIVLTWRKSKLASILLLPYGAWVAFATFLTYQIFLLN